MSFHDRVIPEKKSPFIHFKLSLSVVAESKVKQTPWG